MTGDILRRLREACGYGRHDVAKVMGRNVCAVANLERYGKSWGSRRCGPAVLQQRHMRFSACLDALRILRAELPVRPPEATKGKGAGKGSIRRFKTPYVPVLKPENATHQLSRDGVTEWVRIVPMHGTLRGFVWRGEWVRSSWVEASNEFQAALLAARLPLKKRKTVTVQDATITCHDALRERGW